jgi:hypothetical protein
MLRKNLFLDLLSRVGIKKEKQFKNSGQSIFLTKNLYENNKTIIANDIILGEGYGLLIFKVWRVDLRLNNPTSHSGRN